MIAFRFVVTILDFGGHIEIIKIMYSSQIGCLYKNKHFDISHDIVSQL